MPLNLDLPYSSGRERRPTQEQIQCIFEFVALKKLTSHIQHRGSSQKLIFSCRHLKLHAMKNTLLFFHALQQQGIEDET